MAALQATCDAPAVACVATTALSVNMVTAAANQCIKILGYTISFDGNVSTNTPTKVEYGRPSSAGTFTAVTIRKKDTARAETVQTTGGKNASAEPTWTSVIDKTEYLGQFNGNKEVMVPFQVPIIIAGGARWGIRVTSPNNVNCSSTIDFEE